MEETILVGDRVTELYRGEIFSKENQRICRERIHWMCSEVEGKKIIDVGCSQGITAILLGMEGAEVMGVDIFEEAIEFANKEKAKLPDDVAKRIEFVKADIQDLENKFGEFDTLIIGEILEHFAKPKRLVEASARFLKPGGQVVATTPFGLKPSEDHKFTFTLNSFLELMAPFFEVNTLDVVDGYIRFSGTYNPNENRVPKVSDKELLELTNHGLIGAQELLYKTISEYSTKVKQRNTTIENNKKTILELKNSTSKKAEAVLDFERKVKALRQELKQRPSTKDVIPDLPIISDSKELTELRTQLVSIIQERHADTQSLQKRATEAESKVKSLKQELLDSKKAQAKAKEEVDNYRLAVENQSKKIKCLNKWLSEQDNALLEANKELKDWRKIPSSFRFKLGEAIAESMKSPAKIATLPISLAKILKNPNQEAAEDAPETEFLYTPDEANVIIRGLFKQGGVEAAKDWYDKKYEAKQVDSDFLNRIMFDVLKKDNLEDALPYAAKALDHNPQNYKLQNALEDIANSCVNKGDIDTALQVGTLVLKHSGGRDLKFFEAQEALAKVLGFEAEILNSSESRLQFWKSNVVGKRLVEIVNEKGRDGIDEIIDSAQITDQKSLATIYQSIFLQLRENNPELSLDFGFQAYNLSHSADLGKILYNACISAGNLSRAEEVAKLLVGQPGGENRLASIQGQTSLLRNGFPVPEYDVQNSYSHDGRKIFYFLHNTLPYNSGGYATRSHGIATSLVANGIDFEIYSRLGFPIDRQELGVKSAEPVDLIDGVAYNRMINDRPGFGKQPLNNFIKDYAEEVVRVAKERRPAILHAASNFMNGTAVNYAAKLLGIPSIYEVRGLWEVTRMSRHKGWENTDTYAMYSRMETEACKNASMVVTLTQAMKEEMASRGVDENKIHLVPNGVNSSRFNPIPRNEQLAKELGLSGKTIIGYVGSIVNYEGLDLLLEAAAMLKAKGVRDFAFLIVGDGAVLADLKRQASELSIEDVVTFTGRVPHHEVEEYYSIIDITPYPRKAYKVCEMVSPMKPFESMAMKKAVVSSNVAALAEIVNDGVTGLVHQKNDVQDLARVLETLINDPELRAKLGETAREWVIKERDWKVLALKFIDIYNELFSSYYGKSLSKTVRAA